MTRATRATRRGGTPPIGKRRVPADLALLILACEGIVIRPATLRSWAWRGKVFHFPDGYDVDSLFSVIDERRRAAAELDRDQAVCNASSAELCPETDEAA